MNYAEFKEWLVEFLWKTGDTVLMDRLDQLIVMGTTELNRKLNLQDREVGVYLQVVSEDTDLPDDYFKMRLVGGEWNYVTPSELEQLRKGGSRAGTQAVYSLRDSKLLLCGHFDPATPYELLVTYQSRLPDYQATDSSWVADKFLDLYTYTVLKHAAPFLREDERIAVWAGYATDALASALETDAHDRARGVTARLRLPRQASTSKGRGTYGRWR